MSTVDKAEALAILQAGDASRCLDYFASLEPDARRELAALVKATAKKFRKGDFKEVKSGTWSWVSEHSDEQRECASVAEVAVATAAELKALAKNGIYRGAPDILARVRPDYLDEAAEIIAAGTPYNFPVAFELVNRGLSHRPSHENYALGLVTRSVHSQPVGDDTTLSQRLLQTPALLESEIWQLFEVEGGGEHSLAAHDKYRHASQSWSQALLELMHGGHLDRDRLIDATLSSLARDYAPFRAGWFSRFLTALQLSDAERAARGDALCALLGSNVPATVALALAELDRLEKTEPVSAATLLPALGPATLSRSKSTAKRALSLMRSLAKRDPTSKPDVARAAIHALAHESPDVQKAALDLLDRAGDAVDPELRALMQDAAPSVAATLRQRVAPWIATPGGRGAANATAASAAATAGLANAVAATVRDEGEAGIAAPPSPLDPSRRVQRIESLDELIFAHAHVLEDDSNVMEVERVLDAIARFGAERPQDFDERVSPLVKRAKKQAERYWDSPLIHGLACLALAWTAPPGQALKAFVHHADLDAARQTEELDFGAVWLERCERIARALDEAPGRELLSTPTHEGGFVEPKVLVERLRQQPEPSTFDFVIALLRLAPEGRKDALSLAKALKGKAADALRVALGGAPALDDSPWMLAAAPAPRRYAYEISSRKSGKYTFYSLGVSAEPATEGARRADRPAELLQHSKEYGKAAGFARSLVKWSLTVWPSGIEAYCFDALPSLAGNLDWSSAEWENVSYYELLRDTTLALGPLARVMLCVGLSAKEPGESGVSTDAAIAAIEQARTNGAELGEALSSLRDSGLVKLKRLSNTLGVVARASPLHTRHIVTAIERTLRGDPKAVPRDEGALVALLCELLAETGARIADAEAWSYLSASRHKSKVAEFAPG
ncbi:MAG: DUF6493 family protein [Polyangiaceae bacterium]